MFRIQTLNKISAKGLELFSHDHYEYASELSNPDAIIVRSFKMHDMELPESLYAIARAGAGTNNIPLEKCAERGIVVFNTPGANANAVKELVLMGLLLSSRKIYRGIEWVQSLAGKGEDVSKLVEKEKSNFAGPELLGKKMGVIGLGAIGVMVANNCRDLGMEVSGFDPFISVDAAWGLSRDIRKCISLDSLLAKSDYISLHVPLNDKTRHMLNAEKFGIMKDDVRIMNFARGGLVDNSALIEAVESGKVARYVTDFPEEELLGKENIIPIPHLGASTPESEENCAVMAVNQVRDYLENGNIINSVNFPDCSMAQTGNTRYVVGNRNVPNILGQITAIMADEGLNISDMLNRHREEYAYTIVDTDSDDDEQKKRVLERIRKIDGVLVARQL
jgi:D-3-phosphoglycerate dehydrogenase